MATETAVGAVLVHAHVECRSGRGAWWRYARPVLTIDEPMLALLVGGHVDDEDDLVGPLGFPSDVSPEVRDEFTLRVEGAWVDRDTPRTVARSVADEWLARGSSRHWATGEPFERVTDPAHRQPTWMDARELDRVVRAYQRRTGDLAPVTYCAALAMMGALERDFEVRLVLWLEHLGVDSGAVGDRAHGRRAG
jgi:hypothetical protein